MACFKSGDCLLVGYQLRAALGLYLVLLQDLRDHLFAAVSAFNALCNNAADIVLRRLGDVRDKLAALNLGRRNELRPVNAANCIRISGELCAGGVGLLPERFENLLHSLLFSGPVNQAANEL